MSKKSFIAQVGSQNTIKVFNASNGQLYRVINVNGEIVSSPYVTDNLLSVTVETGGNRYLRVYTLPNGSLKSSTSI